MHQAIDRILADHIANANRRRRPGYRRIYLTMIGSALLISTHIPVLQHLDDTAGGWLVPSVIALAAVFWGARELMPIA